MSGCVSRSILGPQKRKGCVSRDDRAPEQTNGHQKRRRRKKKQKKSEIKRLSRPLASSGRRGAENRIKKNVPGTFKNPMGVEKLRGDSCHNLISLCRHRGRGTSGVSLRSPRQPLAKQKKRNKQTLKAPCVFSCAQSARWRNERHMAEP